jgi:hypothetical protein
MITIGTFYISIFFVWLLVMGYPQVILIDIGDANEEVNRSGYHIIRNER